MAINQVNILDEVKDWAGKYNDTIDEIVVSGLVNGSNQLELTKFGGGVITIDLPFSNDKIISGMDIVITGAGPYTATVSAGTYQINGVPYTYVGGSFPIAITIFPDERIDILYADTSSNVSYLAGIAGPIPIQPNTPLGTLLIGIVYVNSLSAGASAIPTAVSAGFVEGQTLRWNNTSNEWEPTGNLNVSTTGNIGVGTFTTTGARLSVNGAIRLEPTSAPIPPTDKLYNVAGDLFWNGGLVGLADGVTTGSHLYWNGTGWVENNLLLRDNTAFSVDSIKYDTTDATGIRTELHLGDVPVAGERGFQFFVNDTLGDNNMYVLMTAQDSVNNLTTFKVNQADTNLGDSSLFNLSTKSNYFNITDATTGNFYETVQTLAGGVVNRATSPTNEAFTRVQPNQINLETFDAVTPTTYTAIIQSPTTLSLYTNSANPNHISNITSSGSPGAYNFNCGIINRYRVVTANTAVVENDYAIYTTIGFNPLTITLPAAPVDGRMLVIKANSASIPNPVTINGNGKLIDAAATRNLTANFQSVTLHYNNTYGRWMVI